MRDTRFDCLKILAMFGMVTIHGIYRGGALEQAARFSAEWFVLAVIYTLFFAMTNVFVLSSAHFLHNRSMRIHKVGKMALLATGYSCLIYLVLVGVGIIDFSAIPFVSGVFSVFTNQYWFVGAYLILYLVSPYLNKLLNILSKKEIKRLCILLFCVMSVIPTFFVFVPVADLFDAAAGKGIIWFVTLYCICFYINRHEMSWVERLASWKVWLFLVANIAILVLSRVALYNVSNLVGLAGDGETRLYFDSSCFVVAISLAVYVLTLKRKPTHSQKMGKIITTLAKTTLGIYFIHEQPQIKAVLWNMVPRLAESVGILISVCICVVGVFVVCMLIELIRQKSYQGIRHLFRCFTKKEGRAR